MVATARCGRGQRRPLTLDCLAAPRPLPPALAPAVTMVQVETAMRNEWPYIRISWFTNSDTETKAIKKLFLTHFVGLTDLYKHYSGSSRWVPRAHRGHRAQAAHHRITAAAATTTVPLPVHPTTCSAGSVASMNKLEFQHVLLVCRILDVGKEKKLVEKVFVSANKQRNNNPASDSRSLTRFEFFEALLNLACHRFGVGASPRARYRPTRAVAVP